MIDLAILGLLKDRPMHGYQLSREVAEQLGGLWRVSYGSLYPTLRRLEGEGFVEATTGTTTTGGGRRKTVYKITDAGEAEFLRLLEETPGDGQAEDARFRVRVAFFRYLPPETRIRLMERRRAGLETRLAGVNAAITAASADDDRYTLALMEHGRAATASDITWLNELIQAERVRTGITAPRGERRRAHATLKRKERTA
ncbi:MAG TPA: helix-turn-helix transcriptional regulator [Actinomycetota bacterium]|nr:helix-turn-helix transcriptional regulator [Actinomycetota bacterium]